MYNKIKTYGIGKFVGQGHLRKKVLSKHTHTSRNPKSHTFLWSTPNWQMSALKKNTSVHCIRGYKICAAVKLPSAL